MYLEELDLQYLINSVRSVCGKPIFILESKLGPSYPAHTRDSPNMRRRLRPSARLTMTMGRPPPDLAS